MFLKILSLFVCCFLFGHVFSQSLSKRELNKLDGNLHDIFGSDNDSNPARYSEFFFCFLDIDSSGKVSHISILADDKNKGAVYDILTKVTPASFKNWKTQNCNGKTLMIPILFLSSANTTGYIKGIMELYSIKPNQFSPPLSIVTETAKLISLSPFHYNLAIRVNNQTSP